MVHVGELIRCELCRQNQTVTWFAEQLGCSRTNAYKVFSHPDINTYQLLKISKILHHDFFRDYSDVLNGEIEKL